MHRLLQFTLDLFDPAPSVPAASNPPPPLAPKPRARKPPPVATRPAPTERLEQLLQPASFRHPRANREAVLGDSVVAFEFKRSRRRNIGFLVGPEGLTVSAPKWV
ncbi:MAG TPA: metal-dependent hydrolase, partial [Ramlibacter sp.]|nr:metal-dependent hydrolase [Ramlibacter sp.]